MLTEEERKVSTRQLVARPGGSGIGIDVCWRFNYGPKPFDLRPWGNTKNVETLRQLIDDCRKGECKFDLAPETIDILAGRSEMRSEVMPTVMHQLAVGESGHHFSGQYKTKDIRALVNLVKELEASIVVMRAELAAAQERGDFWERRDERTAEALADALGCLIVAGLDEDALVGYVRSLGKECAEVVRAERKERGEELLDLNVLQTGLREVTIPREG